MAKMASIGIQDPLFESANPVLFRIWDTMQRLQTDLCIHQELAAYYSSAAWLNARSVLDLGTGNGYYLRKIATNFPEKHYLGCDSSAEFIEVARRECDLPNLEFRHTGLFEITGRYDFVIMRLLLQHLPDVPVVLEHLARLTDGAVLIIDAYDPVRFYEPPLPRFMKFFQTYADNEARNGRERDVDTVLMSCLRSNPDWRAAPIEHLLIPSTIPGNLEVLRKNYALLIDLVEAAGQFDYDFDSVRKEWRWWCSLERAYTQVGLMLVQLDRAA